MARWSIRRTTALNALRELEEVERGVLFEDRLGRVRLSARGDRLTGAGLAEAIHLSDAGDGFPILGSPQIGYSGRDVVNIAEVEVDQFASGTSAVLWSIGSALTVPQKSTLTLIARYPTPGAPRNHVGVHSWVPLRAGTDYTATSGLAVAAVARGDELRFTLKNSTGADIRVATLQARGVPLLAGDPLVLRLEGHRELGPVRRQGLPARRPVPEQPQRRSRLGQLDTQRALEAARLPDRGLVGA